MPALRALGTTVMLLAACSLSATPARAAVKARNYPVELQDQVDRSAPLLLDIDGDGRDEIVIGTRKRLHALEADGNPVNGFPILLDRFGKLATGLAGGLLPSADGGQTMAVLFGSETGLLVAVDGSGAPLPGFPAKLDGVPAGPPVLADSDGDGRPEIVVATRTGKVWVFDGKGQPRPGYPASCGGAVSTAVTVAPLAPGEPPLLIFGDTTGRLHAWRGPGREAAGFPFVARYTISSQPVLGDIDDDGRYDIVFGSEDFHVYAVDGHGKALPGFPVSTGYRVYSTLALADVDGDGVTDIISAAGDGKLYVYRHGGKLVAGFPVKAGRRLRASACAGDVDGDGRVEIAVGTDSGRLKLFRANGRRYPGFPVRLGERIDVSPLLADLDGDGVIEVLAIARTGRVGAWRMIRKGRGKEALAWPVEARDAARSARTFPNPHRYSELQLGPEKPHTEDTLELSYRHFDLDGDAEPQTLIEWYRNGRPVASLRGRRRVPPAATAKHQKWWYTLRAGPGRRAFRSPRVEIANSPPGPPQIVLEPNSPRHGDDLRLKIVKESADADGDSISYRVSWLQNHRLLKKLRSRRVPGRLVRKGQRWTVVVRPYDGETTGQVTHASIAIGNTPPGAARVHLVPIRPTVTDVIKVVFDKPARDVDGDQLSYRYRWTVDGRKVNLLSSAGSFPAGLARKGERVQVQVISLDGEESGADCRAAVTVVDTPPGQARIKLLPDKPGTTDRLLVRLLAAAGDVDGDALSYRAVWRVAGKGSPAKSISAFSVDPAATARGQKWTVTVVASDGQKDGRPVRAETTIVNTPPQPPRVRARRARVRTGEDLLVEQVQPARDADGDQVTVQVTWFEVGPQGRRQLQQGQGLFGLPAAQTRKNRRYLAVLTPSDGVASGAPARQWFQVINTPPPACRVSILPEKPTTDTPLQARLEAATDADGDRLEPRITWYRDDEPVRTEADRPGVAGKLVKAGQRWRVEARFHDGEEAGGRCTAQVVIANSPPLPPAVQLLPARPRCGDSLVLQVTRPASDRDGDVLERKITWRVDGKRLVELDDAGKVPVGYLRKGQKWSVEVTVSDGRVTSQPARAQVVVANSPPGRPVLAIEPARPLSSDDLHCALVGSTADPDNDRLTYTYQWFLDDDGKRENLRHSGRLLPAAKTRKFQIWTCRAVAADDRDQGPEAVARVKIGNAAPTSPRVGIEPERPRDGDTLHCRVLTPGRDPDRDRVQYRFSWFKDGVRQSFAPQTTDVPARLTHPAEIWQCQVQASDGRAVSAPAPSPEVVVGR